MSDFNADGGIGQLTFLSAIEEDVKRAMRRLVARGEVVLTVDSKLRLP